MEVLQERVANDTNRPLAGQLQSLLEKRRSLYAQADLKLLSDRENDIFAIADYRSIPYIATLI